MSETRNNEASYQPMTFDAIKIGLASPEKSVSGPMVRLPSLRPSTTEP